MPAPGVVLAARYRLDGLLSSGGMGSVYAATHTETGRRFAVKVMLADLSGDNEAERRFMREARLASSMNHPCVIRVYDVGYHEQHPYMVMELLTGESLRQRLARGKLDAKEAAALMVRVLDGVGAAHRMGIVHRDLKPDNIYLCRSPDGSSVEPKVLDFGISKSLAANGTQNLTKTGIALGTPLYMSPEQVRGERDVDARADIYALGVILYEMLAGEVPFNGRNYAELALKIITGEMRALHERDPAIPEALSAVVARAMAVERGSRYRDVEALAQPLQALAHGTLPTAPRVSRAAGRSESRTPFAVENGRTESDEPFVLPKRRNAFLVGAAAAGAALATGAFLLTRSGAAPQGAPAATSHLVVPAAVTQTPALPEPAAPLLAPTTPALVPTAPIALPAGAVSTGALATRHDAADGGVTPARAQVAPSVLTITPAAAGDSPAGPQPHVRMAPPTDADDYAKVPDEQIIDPFE